MYVGRIDSGTFAEDSYTIYCIRGLSSSSHKIPLDRQRVAPILYLYPTPNDSTDAFRYRRRRKIEDIDASYQDVDVPDRYLPSLTSGLAYYMSQKRPQIDVNRRQELKVQYEEEFERAITEDRERVDVRIIPDFGY